MRLSLAVTSVLFFGSYVTAIPVEPQNREESLGLHFPWEEIGGAASHSGSGNNFGAPASHDIYYPPPNHPPPGYPPLGHHNPGNLPVPAPQNPPPPHQDSRGGLFGLPYVCTGCGRQSPGPEPAPGRGVDHPVPSTPLNHGDPNPSIRTGQGGANRRTRTRHRNNKPYARPGSSDPGPGVDHPVPSTPLNHDSPNPSTRTGAGGSNGGAVGVPHATGGRTRGSDVGPPDADGNYRCTNCPYSTRRRGDFRRHGNAHSNERNHACPNCDAKFKERYRLTQHHLKAHPESVLPPTQRVRTSHVSTNPYTRIGPDGPNADPPSHIQCPVGCPSSLYNDRTTVTRHLGEIHDINPKSYPCTIPGCGRTFKRKGHLKEHQELTSHP